MTFEVPPGCSAPKSFRPEAKVASGTQESTCRPDRPKGAGILNQAQVSQAQPQEMPAARANNTCAATTPVRCLNPFQNPGDPPADLPLGIWGIVEGPAQAVEGSLVEYRILLTNGGPAPQPDGDGHELEHLIPIGLELKNYEADSGQLHLHEPTVSGDFTTALLWDGAIPLCGTVAIRVKARVVGEAGSKICLQGTIGADRPTGLRGGIEKGEPFCLQVVLKAPA